MSAPRNNVPDAVRATQARASDPASSSFVSANAGSGKTHVLVQRVIRLLLNEVPPEKILCITFTKAAAANMAERVFSTLGHWVTLDDAALDGAIRHAGIADGGVQLLVIKRHPVAERGEYPFRHVGGRRLGEGYAEDLFRRHAVEQQPDYALHQHMGLARAGIGRDEGGRCRIGRARLRGADGVGYRAGRAYHCSMANPPAADHSLMRARSSYVP